MNVWILETLGEDARVVIAKKPSRKTSRSYTQIRQCMHGMQSMHAHFFWAIL
jgi:hypothetical protein